MNGWQSITNYHDNHHYKILFWVRNICYMLGILKKEQLAQIGDCKYFVTS